MTKIRCTKTDCIIFDVEYLFSDNPTAVECGGCGTVYRDE